MLRIWKRKEASAFPYNVKGPPVTIVADAAISTTAVGDGKFVPVIILDTTTRPDLAELIRIQDRVPPGDVVSAWGQIQGSPKDHVALFMHFERPIETSVAIAFDASRQGSIVELALKAGAIYLQAGKPGDRLSQQFEQPRIIAQLGGTMPQGHWNEVWHRAIKNKLRLEGLTNRDAKLQASRFIELFRDQFANSISYKSGVFVDPTKTTTDDVAIARKL